MREIKYILINDAAIRELLWENLMERGNFYFEEDTISDDNHIYQMLFDRKHCKCLYVSTSVDNKLSQKELEALLQSNETVQTLWSSGQKYKSIRKKFKLVLKEENRP